MNTTIVLLILGILIVAVVASESTYMKKIYHHSTSFLKPKPNVLETMSIASLEPSEIEALKSYLLQA